MSDFGNKKIFSENLKYYMTLNNKDRSKLRDDLKINYSTIRDWTNGRAYPRIDKIEMLANYFGIQKSDLIEKKDNVVTTIEKDVKLTEQITNLAKNEIEKELLIKITMLSNENQNKLLELVNMYLKEQGDYYEKNSNGKTYLRL